MYIIEDIAKDCEDLKDVVLYRGLYDGGLLWARPYDSFVSKVDKEKYPDSDQEYKFELQYIPNKRK